MLVVDVDVVLVVDVEVVLVVDAGEAWAWAGATIELMIGFVHALGRMRAVATPPMMTVRTCLRSR